MSLAPGQDRSPEIAPPERQRDRYTVLALCGSLLVAVWLVFGQTIHHEFVNYDDDQYVTENARILRGPVAEKIGWAFTSGYANNWHPLTWLSHILDYGLYGLYAGGHHATNMLLHAATAILLFLVLRQMTGDLWPSAVVAAIFAVHPLRVESVAWVAERKDVLSGLFFMLTLWAYLGYVRHAFSLVRYLAVVAMFVLGLMAKPMLVTLPFVLLLLDYWPLRRMTFKKPRAAEAAYDATSSRGFIRCNWRLFAEKSPLLAMSAASCVATTWAQGGAIASLDSMSLSARMSNALVSYVAYVVQFFFPAGLAVFYPRPEHSLPLWKPIAAGLALTAISVAVVAGSRRRGWLWVGWFWYLGMLVPVIGLVQVGGQSMADRYTYLPQIGLCIVLGWGTARVVASRPNRRWLCGAGAALMLAILMACAWRQTGFWRNSVTLWSRALACTGSNSVAENNLGHTLAGKGRFQEAIARYRKALEIEPGYIEARNNLGAALAHLDRLDEATAEFRKALQTKPDYAGAQNNLGNALFRSGQMGEAIAHYRKALEAEPDFAEAHSDLGNALLGAGRLVEATAEFRKALESNPDFAGAHNNLGNALQGLGRLDEAIVEYRKATEIMPDFAEARCGLGNTLLRRGRLDDAMAEYRKALEVKPYLGGAHNGLGSALRESGRFDEAIAEYREAVKIQPDDGLAHYNLGNALTICGRATEAMAEFRRAVEINPAYVPAQSGLGNALLACGQFDEAIVHYQAILKIMPDYVPVRGGLKMALVQREEALRALVQQRQSLRSHPSDLAMLNDLAWSLATNANISVRNGAEAIELARRAVDLSGGRNPVILATLAAAYAEAQRFSDAVRTARKAAELAARQDKQDLLESLETQIALYEAKTPFRQTRRSSAHRLAP